MNAIDNEGLLKPYLKQLAFFRIGLAAGVINKEEVVIWADDIIRKEENPHSFICELALYKRRRISDLISFLGIILECSSNLPTGKELLAQIHKLHVAGTLPSGEAVKLIKSIVLYKGLKVTGEFSEEDKANVYQLDNTWDLAQSEIHGSIEDAKRDITEFLAKYQN